MNKASIVFFGILVLLLLSSFKGFAQSNLVCATKITAVNVFLNQAQVTRNGKIVLDAGIHQLVFEKISPLLVQGSIEVKAPAGIEILAVSTQNDFLANNEKPTLIKVLEDSLLVVNELLLEIKSDKDALAWQKELLIANKSIGGANLGVKAEELEDILDIYQKKLHDFKLANTQLNRQERKLIEEKSKIEQQLKEYHEGTLALSNQVIVQVKVNSANPEAQFEIRYLVGGVSWQPFYDIRVVDTKSPVQFLLKASIQQQTGENWNNIKLKLATIDPLAGGTTPVLIPSMLYFVQAETFKSNQRKLENYAAPAAMAEEDGSSFKNNAIAQQNFLNLEFDVLGTNSIPSDNKSHFVELNRFTLEAFYGLACVPKLNTEVFVTANVQSNELISQLNGEANIYLNGTFTGKTYLSQQASDSLLVTLGKDNRVLVKREKVKEMCSKSLFGSNKKDASTIEITLTNTSSEALELNVKDQIPLSSNQEILVKLVDAGGAVYTAESGMLNWSVSIPAKQSKKLRFAFEISYPSGKVITGY